MRSDPLSVGLAALGLVPRPPGELYLPIGQNCTLSWYLKAVGAQTESYPFDWVFSSPGIVADCIETRFARFLDPAEHFELETGPAPGRHRRAGHRRYHRALFNHRSPIPEADLAYYRRCVARFLAVWDSDRPVALLSMALPEHGKRRAWADGFTEAFPAPRNAVPALDYAPVMALARVRRGPTRLVVVQQSTETAPGLDCDTDGVLTTLRFCSRGSSDGVRYLQPGDDAAARRIFAAITGQTLPAAVGRDGLWRRVARIWQPEAGQPADARPSAIGPAAGVTAGQGRGKQRKSPDPGASPLDAPRPPP